MIRVITKQTRALLLLLAAIGFAIAPLIWLWRDWVKWNGQALGSGFQMQYPMERIPFPLWAYLAATASVVIWFDVARTRYSPPEGSGSDLPKWLIPTLKLFAAFLVIPCFLLILASLAQAMTGGRFFR